MKKTTHSLRTLAVRSHDLTPMQGVLGNVVLSGQLGSISVTAPACVLVSFASSLGAWASFSANFLSWACLAPCSRSFCLCSHVEWYSPWEAAGGLLGDSQPGSHWMPTWHAPLALLWLAVRFCEPFLMVLKMPRRPPASLWPPG